jgi:hypothetical protein
METRSSCFATAAPKVKSDFGVADLVRPDPGVSHCERCRPIGRCAALVQTAEHFATTINQLKGKVNMLCITHAMAKSLKVDTEAPHRPGENQMAAMPGTH